jgi:putative phage-type endonuclease
VLTPEQLKIRKSGIGGSDAAAVCGKSKFRTPLDVYNDKTSDVSIISPSIAMEVGNYLEPLIVELYTKKTGNAVIFPGTQIKDILIGNIDGYVSSEKVIVEAKTAAFDYDWGKAGTDEIPTEYLLQCAHYCHIFDIERVDIAVLFKMYDFRIYHYFRNKKLEQKLIDKEYDFWYQHVLKKNPPRPINNQEINNYWQPVLGKTIEASPEIIDKVEALKMRKAQIDKYIQEKETLEKQIKEYMADAEILTVSNEQAVKWSTRRINKFDNSSFSREHPELYSKYKKESESRFFLVK